MRGVRGGWAISITLALVTSSAVAAADDGALESPATERRTLGVSFREARARLVSLADQLGEPSGLGAEAERRFGPSYVEVVGARARVKVDLAPRGAMTDAECTVALSPNEQETTSATRARASDAAWATCDRVFVATQSEPVRALPYSGQIVLADALWGPGALVLAPTIHALHHRPRQAVLSAALRLGAMGVGAAIGAAIALAAPLGYFREGAPCARVTVDAQGREVVAPPCVPRPNYLPGLVAYVPLGLGVGWLAAAIVDAAVLARPSVPGPRLTVTPTLGGLVVNGAF